VTGQKSWTTYANLSDWVFALVRTDFDNPVKQAGISFLLVDMNSPEVSVRSSQLLDGNEDFCDTFFDGVIVPKENLVGELNEGWRIAKALLVHERTMMSQLQEIIPKLPHSAVEYALRYIGTDDSGKLNDPALRSQLTDHLMNTHALGLPQSQI